MSKRVLHVQVDEPMSASLERARAAMEALQQGQTPDAYFGVGFQSMAQMLAVFSAKRMELISYLRAQGPLTLSELIRNRGATDENIESDVSALVEWLAIAQDESGRLCVPWDEIDVHFPLASKAA
jgi:predicted transcriptional regulator